jgi:hypothetical protein
MAIIAKREQFRFQQCHRFPVSLVVIELYVVAER